MTTIRLGSALLASAVLLLGCGGDAASTTTYSAELREVAGSGVRGEARLERREERLEVDIDARGLVPNRIHEQHLEAGGCDGGGARRMLLELEPYPTLGDGGKLSYRNTLEVDPQELEGLEDAAVVILGGRSRGRYRPDVAVACGELRR